MLVQIGKHLNQSIKKIIVIFILLASAYAEEWNEAVYDYLKKNGCTNNHSVSGTSSAEGIFDLNCIKSECEVKKYVYFTRTKDCRIRENGVINFSKYTIVPNELSEIKVLCDFAKYNGKVIKFNQSGICPISVKNLNTPFLYNNEGVLFFSYLGKKDVVKKMESQIWLDCSKENQCLVYILDDRYFYGLGTYISKKINKVNLSCDFARLIPSSSENISGEVYFKGDGYCEIGLNNVPKNNVIRKACVNSIRQFNGSYKVSYTVCR